MKINGSTISITDGTTTETITLAAAFPTNAWTRLKLRRFNDLIYAYVNGTVQSNTCDPVVINPDIIGKNTLAYTDVYSARIRSEEQQSFSIATTPSTLAGSPDGFSRLIAFTLRNATDSVLIDNLNGFDGYRIEIVNKYISSCVLKFTVGDGSQLYEHETEITEEFYANDLIFAVVELEHLSAQPDAGDTSWRGIFSPNTGATSIGSTVAGGSYAGLNLHSLICLDGQVTTAAQRTWWYNSGLGRAWDEYNVSSTIASTDPSHVYTFEETSGTRYDSVGTAHLTENVGYVISATHQNGGFETSDGGTWLDQWTQLNGGAGLFTVETTDVYAGSQAVTVTRDGTYTRIVHDDIVLNPGFVYDVSIYAKIADVSVTRQFTIRDQDVSGAYPQQSITFTSTDWTEYTTTITPVLTATGFRISDGTNMEAQKAIFDNITISADKIGREFGLQSSHFETADFFGYIQEFRFTFDSFECFYPLYTDANDTKETENHGTTTSVTFIVSDPGSPPAE